MKGGEVAGQTDFFYGFGTCWVTDTAVTLRSCGGGITAWKGTNTTFVNKYGVYIVDSTVEKANSSLSIAGKCALGRPWVRCSMQTRPRDIEIDFVAELANARHLREQLSRQFDTEHWLHRLGWHTKIQQLHTPS